MTPKCSSWSKQVSTSVTRSGTPFDFALIESRPGFVLLKASGRGAQAAFSPEAGGHRFQRVPPNEKRDRVQTSTITVAILGVPEAHALRLDDKDLVWTTCRGSGAGGQHRNTTDSAVQVTHTPSKLSVRCESERSQHQNRETALQILRSRLVAAQTADAVNGRNSVRKAQVGSGMRGDKVRTLRQQDDMVTDHRTGKRMSWKRYEKGFVEELR